MRSKKKLCLGPFQASQLMIATGLEGLTAMGQFVRQKRQSRFYWAEIGFLLLGLFGLQPSLFTQFLLGTQTRDTAYPNPNYTNSTPNALDAYKDWAAAQLTSWMQSNNSIGGAINTGNGWAPLPVNANGGYLPSTNANYNNAAYNSLNNYQNANPYSNYAGNTNNLFATNQLPANNSYLSQYPYGYPNTTANPQYNNGGATNAWPNAAYHPAQSNYGTVPPTANSYSPYATAPQYSTHPMTSPNYQGNTGYNNTAPAYGNSNVPQSYGAAVAAPYGTTHNSYQPSANYQPNPSYHPNTNANYYSSSNSYMPNNNGAWQRYQPPTAGSYMYR